jgi:threonine synthase
MPNRFIELACLKCGKTFLTQTHSRCNSCGGILSANYDTSGSFPTPSKQLPSSIWHFRDFFPPVKDSNIVSMGEGWTPLVKSTRYGRSIGIKNLLCKLEGQNPSGSFKDRVASLGLSLARQWKKKGVYTASSGNAAAAISAYSARAGIPCLILIREDSSISKLGQISMYGPKLLRVRNIFRDQASLASALSLTQKSLPEWFNHFVWAPYNPLLVDALKTVAYEIFLSNATLPDSIFVPSAGGDLIFGIYKGFKELKEMDVIDRIPKMVVAQGADASPTVKAIEKKEEIVPETKSADTVAGALRVNFGAEHTLQAVYNSKGFGIGVTDKEIISAQREVAKLEGIFCEISSATALAAIAKAARLGKISKEETATAILTGIGFKEYYPAFKDSSRVPLATSVKMIPTILKTF